MHSENLSLYRGDTHKFSVEVMNDDGSTLDLTGSDIAMLVKPKGEYTPFSPNIAINGNVITIIFEPTHTQGAMWRTAEYDVQLTQGDIVTTILKGRIELTQDITP